MKIYYKDVFNCPCGHTFIINVPVLWAMDNQEKFEALLKRQEQAQYDHQFCAWKAEVKAFLKQPVIIKVST